MLYWAASSSSSRSSPERSASSASQAIAAEINRKYEALRYPRDGLPRQGERPPD